MEWESIVEQSVALLIGGITGGLLGAIISLVVHFHLLKKTTERQLLSEALAIQSLKEAWILEGPDSQRAKLSETKNLLKEFNDNGFWLRKVEIRFVLDDARWNSPEEQYYGVINGRRAWIVRDQLHNYPSLYSSTVRDDSHPALLSSRAFEELAGWIERVANTRSGFVSFFPFLPKLEMLNHLLGVVATEDRIEVFRNRLSKEAKDFLKEYREKHIKILNNIWLSSFQF